MWKWIKYILLIGLPVLAAFLYVRYLSCKKKGDAVGAPYSCPLFCSEPIWLVVQNILYIMRQDKCYEVTDYGKSMSYRQVGLSKCGESEVKKSNEIEEAIFEEEIT